MKEISVAELKSRLEAGTPVSIVDIREADEFRDWHIAGSSNVPVYDAMREGRPEGLTESAAGLSRERPVVTVCRGGIVSRRAAELFDSLGFDAASLAGGIRAWGGVWSETPIAIAQRPDASLLQIRRNSKGCLSYLIGSRGSAVVVDPSVDFAAYTAAAERLGLRIEHVLETHVHADHLSRARELAETVGAKLLMCPNERVAYPYSPIRDGETIEVGDLVIEALTSPGHTMESICFLVDGKILFTGDTLFLDSVGRPDLERGDAGAEDGARALWGSLQKLMRRFSDVAVYPAHHSGPIGFDEDPIGISLAELRSKLDLLAADERSFTTRVLGGLRAKPPNHEQIIAVNEGKENLGPISPLDLEAGPNRCAAK